jgi:hypothetical protein
MTFTRFLIAEKASRYFRTGHIVNALSAAQNRVAALLRNEDAGFFSTYYDYTSLVIDQPNYDLPPFFKAPMLVERVDGNFAESPVEVRLRRTKTPAARSSDTTYDIVGKEIHFHPRPSSATPTYRLWYTFSLPDLAYGNAPAGGAEGNVLLAPAPDANLDYFAAVPLDDYYNNITFEVVSGTAAGEVFVVDDYVGSTRAITPVTDLGTALAEDDVYASHIGIDEDLWECLCLMAAHLSRARDKDGNYLYGREFISAWQTLVGDTRLRLNTMGEVRLYGIDGVA